MHWVYDYGHHINNTVATEHRATFIQNNCVLTLTDCLQVNHVIPNL